jgi:hypothetical protein
MLLLDFVFVNYFHTQWPVTVSAYILKLRSMKYCILLYVSMEVNHQGINYEQLRNTS